MNEENIRNNLLTVKNLTKSYPDFLLKDVSFALRPGRIMGLIGKNGAAGFLFLELKSVNLDLGAERELLFL